MALKTLDRMARGGIRDHLAGGYHRYSTVRDWTVPHFEKMLYDNAQLAEAHVLAFEATGDPRWRAEAEATFAFVARTMTAPDGLFYSALDAESEGEEGKSYVWTREEVEKVLGPGDDFAALRPRLRARREPNFEGDRYVLLEPEGRSPTRPSKPALAPLRPKAPGRPRPPARAAARRQGPDLLECPDDRRLCRGLPRPQGRPLQARRREGRRRPPGDR